MKVKPIKKIKGQTDIPITTEFIKLDSFLKLANVAETGGDAKNMVLEGRASVNGEVCLMRGKKLRPGDLVNLEGEALRVVSNDV